MGNWLGQELRRLRLAQGLSLRVAAQKAGLPHMTYTAYELGKAVPPPVRREALSAALGITPRALDELVEEDEYEVFLRSRKLSDAGRAAARDFLRRVREDERAGREGPGDGSNR